MVMENKFPHKKDKITKGVFWLGPPGPQTLRRQALVSLLLFPKPVHFIFF